ncbi:proline-rich protein HaeIII subfamily 1-like [Passer montanus]|uniref:proline-rich protein HaeIII subfamily 1-like n=1 Tax=Passer montanus TaxID=9160 RepID=UPI0019615037|nr:proline-rich protein HaeIII subfamily 1-like [Passer montanus]
MRRNAARRRATRHGRARYPGAALRPDTAPRASRSHRQRCSVPARPGPTPRGLGTVPRPRGVAVPHPLLTPHLRGAHPTTGHPRMTPDPPPIPSTRPSPPLLSPPAPRSRRPRALPTPTRAPQPTNGPMGDRGVSAGGAGAARARPAGRLGDVRRCVGSGGAETVALDS